MSPYVTELSSNILSIVNTVRQSFSRATVTVELGLVGFVDQRLCTTLTSKKIAFTTDVSAFTTEISSMQYGNTQNTNCDTDVAGDLE
jgi:hypothetical protein